MKALSTENSNASKKGYSLPPILYKVAGWMTTATGASFIVCCLTRESDSSIGETFKGVVFPIGISLTLGVAGNCFQAASSREKQLRRDFWSEYYEKRAESPSHATSEVEQKVEAKAAEVFQTLDSQSNKTSKLEECNQQCEKQVILDGTEGAHDSYIKFREESDAYMTRTVERGWDTGVSLDL